MTPRTPPDQPEALELLKSLNPPARLVRHVELVGEAADVILKSLQQHHVEVDESFVRVGVVLHDVGKTVHTKELDASGSAHESAGEELLLELGVSVEVARVCRSHAQWSEMPVSLEELLVALADKLWKGVRVPALELEVIDRVASLKGVNRWDLFAGLDTVFEEVAADGEARLARSNV